MPSKASAGQAFDIEPRRFQAAKLSRSLALERQGRQMLEMLASDPQRVVRIVPLLADRAEGLLAAIAIGEEFRLDLAGPADNLCTAHNCPYATDPLPQRYEKL